MITLDTTFKRAVLNIIFCTLLWTIHILILYFLMFYLNYDDDDLGFWDFCCFLIAGFNAYHSIGMLVHPQDPQGKGIITWGFIKFKKPKKLYLKQRILNVFYYLLISFIVSCWLCYGVYRVYGIDYWDFDFFFKFLAPIIFVHTIFVYRNKVKEATGYPTPSRRIEDDPFDDSNYSPHDYKRRNIGNKTMMGYD